MQLLQPSSALFSGVPGDVCFVSPNTMNFQSLLSDSGKSCWALHHHAVDEIPRVSSCLPVRDEACGAKSWDCWSGKTASFPGSSQDFLFRYASSLMEIVVLFRFLLIGRGVLRQPWFPLFWWCTQAQPAAVN